jgi:hypothetical protein
MVTTRGNPPMSEATPLERALILCDDLATLKPEERIAYYKAVCESAGLNPATKPLNFLLLDGKLVLYAGREATDQLRKLHGISVLGLTKEIITGDSGDEKLLFVVVQIKDNQGREDVSTSAVAIGGLKGDALANAYMKAETKAKRRATLSICGLGILDECELGTIPPTKTLLPAQDNKPVVVPAPTVAPAVNQAAAPPVVVTPAPTPFANTTPPPKEHCTTVFPPSMLPPPVAVIPPAPPKAAPAATSVPPVPQSTPPVVAAPVAPPQPPVVPVLGTVVPKPATAPAPAPMPAPPVTAPIVPGGEAPATPEEYQNFVGKRAAKLVRDKLTPAGLKQAGDLMKAYLLKQSGKVQLKQISAATFEAVLAALESATPEQAVSIVQEGAK